MEPPVSWNLSLASLESNNTLILSLNSFRCMGGLVTWRIRYRRFQFPEALISVVKVEVTFCSLAVLNSFRRDGRNIFGPEEQNWENASALIVDVRQTTLKRLVQRKSPIRMQIWVARAGSVNQAIVRFFFNPLLTTEWGFLLRMEQGRKFNCTSRRSFCNGFWHPRAV